MEQSIFIRNVRPMGGKTTNLRIEAGKLAARGPELANDGGLPEWDGRDAITLPAFVETHVHLDKILWGLPWTPNCAGPSLWEMIENEKRLRGEMAHSVETRAGNLIRQCVAMGSTFIRSHVDIDPDYGLSNLHGVLKAREAHAHAVDIEIVAFPQVGVLRRPGTAELMEAATREGASVIGGLDPAGIDGDAVGQLDIVFGIAERQGVKVDIHLHDPGTLGLHEIKLIAERTQALGLAGRVTISHAFCLADADEAQLEEAARRLVDAGVSLITAAPSGWRIIPVLALRERGVRLACGSDAIRDTWIPFGNGDMLDRAMIVAYLSGFRKDHEDRKSVV